VPYNRSVGVRIFLSHFVPVHSS